MKRIAFSLALAAIAAVAGCDNKQAKLNALKAQYDPLNKQYQSECIDPASSARGAEGYLSGTPAKVPTPQEEAAHNQKCAQELSQIKALEQQMQPLQK